IQSKQFWEIATASAVSSLCFFDSAPSENTCLPRSPNPRYTFIGDLSIRPFSRFFSAFRSWMCMGPPIRLRRGSARALPLFSGELVGARLGQSPQGEQQANHALLDEQRILCVRITQPLARPVALLLRKAERRRQDLELQQEVVGRQTSGTKPRHDRSADGRIPDS